VRRGCRVLLGYAAMLAMSAPAAAESTVTPRGSGSTFVADDARPLPHLGATAQLRLVWDKDPVVRRSKEGDILATVVENQLETQLVVGLGLLDRFELAAQLTGRLQQAPDAGLGALIDGASVRQPWLSARFLALDLGWLQASARVRTALLDRVEPGAVVVVNPGWARFTLDTGVTIASSSIAVPFALSASVPVHEHVALTAELFGSASNAEHIPLEVMAGARGLFGPASVVVGVGGGVLPDVGTPAFRVLGGVQWRFDPALPEPVVLAAVPVDEPPPTPVPEGDGAGEGDDVEGADDANTAEAEAAKAEAVAVAEVADEQGQDDPDVHVDAGGVTFSDHVVFFPVDRDTLLPQGRRLLGVVARELKQMPEVTQIIIKGHADATGDAAFNRKLSSWRALAVRRSLIAWGIPANRIIIRAVGSSEPVADNTTTAGRRQNRRVEITFENAEEAP
jgi:outer membrane protein OmpA-like peptidoglycan-associated protein